MLIGRDELINKAIHYAINKRSMHIKAENGTGKTTLLKHLEKKIPNSVYSSAGTKKEILTRLSEKMELTTKANTNKLLENLMFELEVTNLVLLQDDTQELTKSVNTLLTKLESHGLTIISTGSKNSLKLKETSMNSLNKNELGKLVKSRKLRNKIINECSTPLEVKNAIRKAKNINIEGSEYIESISKKHELLASSTLIVIASIMLSVRYYYYMRHEYTTGYTIALIAYLIKAVTQVRKQY